MERFYLEEASLERKDDVKSYIEEHFLYNSNIAGDGGLEEEYKNYEEWLEKKDYRPIKIHVQMIDVVVFNIF